MQKVASTLRGHFVVADNDASNVGLNAAKAIRWPYFMPGMTGEDFNDFALRVGGFCAFMALKKGLQQQR